MEFRNGESGMHVLNVQAMTEMILTQLMRLTDQYPLTTEDISLITMASSLHDIGKIAIPEEILNKPGRFTDEEFAIMKTHSAVGSDMLDDLELYKDEKLVKVARDICRWHHERWDGRGYPDGLVGDDIPISAQVVALADVYDALTSRRVYKPPFSHEEALRMIREGECGAFNPLILECLTAVAGDLEKRLNHGITGREISIDSLHLSEATLDNGDAEASSRTLEPHPRAARLRAHEVPLLRFHEQRGAVRVHRRAADDRAVRLERPQARSARNYHGSLQR